MNTTTLCRAAVLCGGLFGAGQGHAECARLSTFLPPPVRTGVMGALLHEVDGRLAGSLDSEVVRVDPGARVLKIGPRLVLTRPAGPTRSVAAWPSRSESFSHVTLEIEPNYRYHLGVRWVASDAASDTGAWEPVVWKKTPESCR